MAAFECYDREKAMAETFKFISALRFGHGIQLLGVESTYYSSHGLQRACGHGLPDLDSDMAGWAVKESQQCTCSYPQPNTSKLHLLALC